MRPLLIMLSVTLLLPACTYFNVTPRSSDIKLTPPTEGCAQGSIRPDGSCAQTVH